MAEALPPLELDGAWKEALEHFLELFLSWRFPHIHADIDWREEYRSLDQELHKLLPRDASGLKRVDRLIEVTRLGGDQALLHVEAQHQGEDDFEHRMDDYHDRIEVSRGLPVVSIAILGDDDPSWHPRKHAFSLWGCTKDFTFLTVKLLEWAGRLDELEANPNPFCLFVAAHLEALATRKDAEARQRAKVRLLANHFQRKLEEPDGKLLYRLIDWLLLLPREREEQVRTELNRLNPEGTMTYITSFERIGMEKGMEKGMEEGTKKGREQGVLIGRIQLCQRLLRQAETPSDELGRLPLDELTRQAEELERRLAPADNGAE
jgi:hypothetical protein